ncbi:MAG TPA: lectin like domain-containing protein [Thermoleophilia bacterium]|nr:lectin like domain-containing protein [Thermoleophilia bacterium]
MSVPVLCPRGGRRVFLRPVFVALALTLAALALLATVAMPSSAATLELTADPSATAVLGPPPASAGGHGTGLRSGPVDFTELQGAQISPELLTYPTSFDLRTLGRLTPVKDQGIYGTCWAFAAYGSLESSLMPGEVWDFSEDNMAWFHGFDWRWDEGGNPLMAAAYLLRWRGPFTEAQDAYADGVHPDPSTLTAQKHVQRVVMLPPRAGATANDDLKYALTTYGAVTTSMYWMAGSLNTATGGYYYSGTAEANHGVTLVGWDDGYSRSNFAVPPPGDGAFIVRNSWGSTWGDDIYGDWDGAGYFYVSYYDAEFGYATNAVFDQAQPTDNYARVYQYDPLGFVSSVGFPGVETAWFANQFTAAADEQLAAVGFYSPAPDATYQVYAGASFATKQLRASGTLSDFGYHTIQLGTPMALTAGQPFVVAVKLTVPFFDGSWVAPIVVEIPLLKYSSKATASAGQSFYSSDGATWTDFTTFEPEGNVCLKAYTRGAGPMPPAVTAPNGGESWPIGSPQTITWSGGGSGTATIELSLDGGSTYPVTIADGTANDGSHPWVVAADSTPLAKVRVTTATGADESDGVFTIYGTPVEQGGWLAQLTGTTLALWDVAGSGEPRAWAAGDDGTIVVTADGGATWAKQKTGVLNDLRGVDFLDGSFGYAVGLSGRILRTRDAGATWVKLSSGASLALNGVDVVDATRAAAAGREGIFRTADGGATWKHQTSGLADAIWLRDVDFISPQRGWAVGQGGQIFATTNAGGSWRRQTSGTTEHLEAVAFLSSQWGWAIGRNGTVLRTLDGGATWERVGVPTAAHLWDVEFVGAELGWIVGDGGVVLKTVDGGVTWVLQELGWTPPALRGVTMQSEGYGWAAGLGGTALRLWPGSGADDLLPPHTEATPVLDRWFNVPVPIGLTASDASGVERTEYRLDGGDWQDGAEAVVEAPLDATNDGYHWVDYRSVDTLGNVESFHTAEARIDTQRPVTAAPYKATVKRYDYVTLKYKVKDPLPNAGTAKVTIKVKKLDGSVVKKFLLGSKKVNVLLGYRWKCGLAKGTYRFYVYATDPAGNTQSVVGYNRLVVY